MLWLNGSPCPNGATFKGRKRAHDPMFTISFPVTAIGARAHSKGTVVPPIWEAGTRPDLTLPSEAKNQFSILPYALQRSTGRVCWAKGSFSVQWL